ncbi:MAG: leucine-rich repeat domain-containing protein, partial [Oscillospiraceae bacterium]|nr:leucine-rich repeat domain-containing protein [Oscillospiraceae bacterium]
MKTKLFVTLLAVLILLTLAACGGSPLNSAAPANDRTASPRGGGTATTAPDSTETPADSTDEPQTGGDYTMEALLELPEDDADDYVYYEADDGNVYITRTSGAGEIAVIPSMINGKPVTQINRAFLNNNRIKAVVIPETVTSIGDSAFQANSKLEIVVIKGENLTSIGEQAFL